MKTVHTALARGNKRVSKTTNDDMRLIAISATIPNVEDVSDINLYFYNLEITTF